MHYSALIDERELGVGQRGGGEGRRGGEGERQRGFGRDVDRHDEEVGGKVRNRAQLMRAVWMWGGEGVGGFTRAVAIRGGVISWKGGRGSRDGW